MIREIKEVLLKEEGLSKDRIEQIKNSKNIGELNLSIEEAIALLNKENIPIVLHEEDKAIFYRKCDYSGIEDLVLVHKTDFMPKNSEIIPAQDRKLIHSIKITNKVYVDLPVRRHRHTVHFAVNHEVRSHEGGNWDNCKYIILIPWKDVPNEQIIGGKSVDIYTNGSVKIDKGYCLAPIEQVQEIQKENPNLTVIGYEGKPLGYGDAFVSTLGYRFENSSDEVWISRDDQQQFDQIMNKLGKKCGRHFGSNEMEEDSKKEKIEITCVKYKYIYDNFEKLTKDTLYQGVDIYDLFFTDSLQFLNLMDYKNVRLAIDVLKEEIGIPDSLVNLLDKIEEYNKEHKIINVSEICRALGGLSTKTEIYLTKKLKGLSDDDSIIGVLVELAHKGIISTIARKNGLLQNDEMFFDNEQKLSPKEMEKILWGRYRDGLISYKYMVDQINGLNDSKIQQKLAYHSELEARRRAGHEKFGSGLSKEYNTLFTVEEIEQERTRTLEIFLESVRSDKFYTYEKYIQQMCSWGYDISFLKEKWDENRPLFTENTVAPFAPSSADVDKLIEEQPPSLLSDSLPEEEEPLLIQDESVFTVDSGKGTK